ncbi:hypothetical protein [Lactobacillus gallinarum]|nr:hypothetical protein [Lactobacillus gallinarum]
MSKLGWTDSGFVKNQTLKSTDLTASAMLGSPRMLMVRSLL